MSPVVGVLLWLLLWLHLLVMLLPAGRAAGRMAVFPRLCWFDVSLMWRHGPCLELHLKLNTAYW